MRMERTRLTTPVASRMLRVGERSGNMGEMTERIAAFYDEELARWVDIVTRLIEPVLMTLIGLMIGVIVVLMYFPIFELAGSINERLRRKSSIRWQRIRHRRWTRTRWPGRSRLLNSRRTHLRC